MPYAFVKGGYILSTIVLLCITMLAMVVTSWIPQVMARAEGLTRANERRLSLSADAGPPQPVNEITSIRRFEMNELCGLFVGPRYRIFYEVRLSACALPGVTDCGSG